VSVWITSMMLSCDEDLVRRLPLPLAQLYRRAHNAKTPPERHHAAYYLWEAALKLLGSVAIVEYAELGDHDPELAERLHNLARPALGHWWEFVRRLLPVLADRGDRGFVVVRDLLLGKSRDDLPHAAGLDALLVQVLEGWDAPPARTTVRPTELFDRLVRYRNREIGHGAVGQRSAAFYDRMGRALLAGVPEVLGRLDLLAGRRLLYVADVRRHGSGRWLVERYELRGEALRRLESLDLPDADTARRLVPERLYLEAVSLGPLSPLVDVKGKDSNEGQTGIAGEARTVSLQPLLVYEAEAGETLFLNARRGRQRIVYLSYSTGKEVERDDLGPEQRELLARVLHVPVDARSVTQWAVLSQAEEQAESGPEERPAPRRLGEFELLSELGRGGMGVVYRAWQPSLGRQVAVKKLYRTGDPKAEARFGREVRALGHVEHPHLVKIFTSGNDGEEWFYAMELVEGATLAAVCEKLQSRSSQPETLDFQAWQQAVSTVCAEARQAEKPLSDAPSPAADAPPVTGTDAGSDAPHPAFRVGQSYVRQAVELVRQVAEAAHALHERGILHRDIKPGNIMVTGDGNQSILMDLGLAQIADEVEGRLTKTRQFVGTLRYASPEQVLAVGGLERRSDVYSLGATLWELLTFRPMFNATDQTPTAELMRRIQVEEPERPGKYHSRVSRDLEAIVLKCLEKDPKRRYATARELMRDLERYQAGEPVQARRIGELQRGWRWCRRNPALAGVLAALVLVLDCSIAGLTVLYLNAERQRKIAQDREAEAQAVTRFYEEHVLAAARPKGWAGGAGKDLTLKEALDQASPKIEEAFAGQPQLAATVHHTLGMTYWYLGLFEAANAHLEKAHAIRHEILGPDNPDTLTSLHDLAMQRWKQGELKEAVALAREALERRRRVLAPEHEDTLWTQLNLGMFCNEVGQFGEAEALLREAIESCKRTLGPDHHHTLYGQNDLALSLWFTGRREESVALDRQTLEGRRRSLGLDHPDTLRSVCNLADSLKLLGKLEEAEAMYRQSLLDRRRILGPDHEETLWSESGLGDLLGEKGKYEEAEKLLRHCLAVQRKARGADDLQLAATLALLGDVLIDKGQPLEAELLLRECLKIREKKLPLDHWSLANAHSLLGAALARQGKFTEAERFLLDGYERLTKAKYVSPPRVAKALDRVIELYDKWGKLEQAEAWRKKRPQAGKQG
jgi:serine/threonine protein kinase